MNIELLTIGSELLLGFTVDTNGAELARALSAVGVQVVRRTSVGDDSEAIRRAVLEALGRTGAVLTTGGLGPTRDDVSKVVVAELFGAPLEFDEAVWQALVERFARMGRTPPASNRSQAQVPRGATVLPNRWGTAPGLWLEGPPGLAIMLPGVPGEMRKLMEHEVVPRLAARSDGAVIRSRLVRTTGIPESTLAERLGEIEQAIAPLSLAYLPGYEGVDLRVSAWRLPAAEADARLAAATALLRQRAGQYAYGEGDDDLAALVLESARARRLSLGTAESCTGGLVAARLTEIPGSSDVFIGAVVCYANALKTSLLEVDPELIAADGAVSESVARAMARGACRRLGVDVAVAVTGIAGPAGGTASKPVGTVWLALAQGDEVEARRLQIPGDRHNVRVRSAQAALQLLWRRLAQSPA
ncbi:MAG TPA: competence/damage-inducible protein A [Gemmatimonadales bacterium]|nr:competence/damage-inducible protein A [Gemmatimonadales bacterium]